MPDLFDEGELTEEQAIAFAQLLPRLVPIPSELADPAKLQQEFVEKWRKHQKRRKLTAWQKVACRIPGTKNFRRWFAQQAITHSNAGLFLLLTLKSVPLALKGKLFRPLKKLEHRAAPYEAIQQFAMKELLWGVVVVGLISSLTLPLPMAKMLTGFSAVNWPGLLVFAALYVPVVRLSLSSLSIGWGKSGSLNRVFWMFGVWPAAFVGGFAWLRHRMFERPHSSFATHCAVGLIASLMAVAIMWVAVAVAAAAGRALVLYVEFRKKRNCPVAMVVDSLLLTLHALDKRKFKDLAKATTKAELIPRIEDVAASVERVPRGMPSGDAATESWLKDEMTQIAGGVRSLKKWVLTPKADTHSQLYDRLVDLLRMVVTGNWDSMPRGTPGKVARPRRWVRRVFEILSAVMISSLAILTALVVPHSPLSELLSPGNLLIGGGIWVLLVVLAVLDPEKIRNLREILQLSAEIGKRG